MSRTHETSAYDFRSLGIASFIIAASFFINAVPALAATTTDQTTSSSSQTTWRDSHGIIQRIGNWNPEGRTTTSGAGRGGDNTSSGGSGGEGSNLTDRIANLQERIKKLDEMKAQLEKLLLSLQQHASTTADKPTCPMALGRLFGSSATTTTSHEGCRPLVQLPHPIRCPEGSHAEMQWRMSGTTTPNCRPNRDDTHDTLTGNGNLQEHSHGTTTNREWNGHISTSSNPWSRVKNGSAFSGGGFGGGSSAGQVHGASSDMSAEMADTLESLKGDLLDISDMLKQ